MNQTLIQQAAAAFGAGTPVVEPLGQGLIHHTYKASYPAGDTIVLQSINRAVFREPEAILYNYRLVQECLEQRAAAIKVAPMLSTTTGKDHFTDEAGSFWRATLFIPNSRTTALAADAGEAYAAAWCFAAFTSALGGLPASRLKNVLPGFHNLSLRYRQFEDTVKSAHISRLLKATHVISELRDRDKLLHFYEAMVNDKEHYPVRIMHHDCKIGNVLFEQRGQKALCPVDLDTVMPGHYFSDLGDMIRSMACTEDENSTAWELIDVNKTYYDTIISGYLAGMSSLTHAEQKNIHKAGLIMTYMQCMRYVTDFLENDVYYRTSYPEQNLNRALNQLILLEKLEELEAAQ